METAHPTRGLDPRFAEMTESLMSKQDLDNGLRRLAVSMVLTNFFFWSLAVATLRAL